MIAGRWRADTLVAVPHCHAVSLNSSQKQWIRVGYECVMFMYLLSCTMPPPHVLTLSLPDFLTCDQISCLAFPLRTCILHSVSSRERVALDTNMLTECPLHVELTSDMLLYIINQMLRLQILHHTFHAITIRGW